MEKFKINQSNDGSVFFTDENGNIYLPCTADGKYQFFDLESANLISYFTDGRLIYSTSPNLNGLGWIGLAIQAGASIFGSISSSVSQKKANASAEKQIQLQNQGLELQKKIAEIQQASFTNQSQINSSNSGGTSLFTVLALSAAGIAFVGGGIYLLKNSSRKKKEKALK